jgi:TrmH family RNA methyltransferase
MISKNELKYIQSFAHKKQWAQESVFIAEGPKVVGELLDSDWEVEAVYGLESWAKETNHSIPHLTIVSEEELERMSLLQQANQVIAIVKKKQYHSPMKYQGNFTLVLDGIQDPGNLGTIIRTFDWFGGTQIIVTEDTAGVHNPKVVQSTMGSFLRVRVEVVQDMTSILALQNLPVYGALLEGTSMYQTAFQQEGFLIIGNESKGIRTDLLPLITEAISIPQFGQAESLNAAVATGIILSHWKNHN